MVRVARTRPSSPNTTSGTRTSHTKSSLLASPRSRASLFLSREAILSSAPGTLHSLMLPYESFSDDRLCQLSYALYSSLSPGLQKYLEGLSAVHSAVAQAQGARAGGTHVRRKEIETIHPVVRVHPATGWKSIYVNPGT